MSSDYSERMNDLESLVLEKRQTIGNLSGVPFVVFPYAPNKELSFEDDIDTFVEKLEFNELSVSLIDLRELFFTILENENLLDPVVEVERNNPEDLREGLNSALFEEYGESRGEMIDSLVEDIGGHDAAIIYRCGILFPFSSLSVILSQLENVIETPLIIFYPAVVDEMTVRFLDETEGQYYRAKVI